MKLNVGAGRSPRVGYINIDTISFPGINIICNINGFSLPFSDSCFSEILIEHTLEHIHNFIPLMEEIHRIGVNGAIVYITTPYYRYEGAFHDPTHVRFFSERTFDIFRDDYEYNYYSKARFDVLKVSLRRTQKTKTPSLAKKLMILPIPFRRFLNNFLWNLYSEIYYELSIKK